MFNESFFRYLQYEKRFSVHTITAYKSDLQAFSDYIKSQFEIDDLCAKLEAAGLPYAKVVRPDQLVNDEHLIQSGGMVPMTTDEGTTTQAVLLPLMMGGRRPGVRRPIAKVGEHTQEILAALRNKRRPA